VAGRESEQPNKWDNKRREQKHRKLYLPICAPGFLFFFLSSFPLLHEPTDETPAFLEHLITSKNNSHKVD